MFSQKIMDKNRKRIFLETGNFEIGDEIALHSIVPNGDICILKKRPSQEWMADKYYFEYSRPETDDEVLLRLRLEYKTLEILKRKFEE